MAGSSRRISLRAVIDALEMQSDSMTGYLHRRTGETYALDDDDGTLGDGLDDEEDTGMPDWEREHRAKAAEILDSEDWLPLPDSFDIHEWDLMRQFVDQTQDDQHRRELNDAIHGRGAFRAFKSAIHRIGIQDQWFRFRDEALAQIARDWLEEHELSYNDDWTPAS